MKNKFFIFLLIGCLSNVPLHVFSQNADSSDLRISLLTCTPGSELYSIFGHSAIRVIDSTSLTDIVYNYGTFNFDDDGFYIKFIRGKLLYYISIASFEDFVADYKFENRAITEQVLDLKPAEKLDFRHALNENLREENKFYKYDFFLDNCTTRLRDLIIKYKNPSPALPAIMPANTRFRQAIHTYLDKSRQYWSKLGIDILLGAPTDAVMTISQQQFLPDNLMFALDSATNTRVVLNKQNLYPINESSDLTGWFTPILFFLSLLTLMVLLSLSKNKKMQATVMGLDGFILFITGALGILLIFMMTATDHSMTKNNYNILWAWPTHIIAAFFVSSSKKWVRIYFLIYAIFLCILLLSWTFLPQEMNNALIPFILLMIYRSAMKYFNYRL